MKVQIDGQEQSVLEYAGKSLGEVLEQVKELLKGSEKMIIGIECDDRILRPEEIEEELVKPAESYQSIDFQTGKPSNLALEAIEASKALFVEISSEVEQIVERLQRSEVQDALRSLGTIFQKFSNACKGIKGTMVLMNINPESIELSSGSAAKLMVDITEQLKDVKEALTNNDYVQLADLLSYEFGPTVKSCESLTDSLIENISD